MIAILYYFDWEIREGRGKIDRLFRFRERDETAKYLTFIRLFLHLRLYICKTGRIACSSNSQTDKITHRIVMLTYRCCDHRDIER